MRGKKTRIYLSPPHLSGHELDLVIDTFSSNWIAPTGPNLDAFETEFSRIMSGSHCVALNSGTAALHLALKLSGVGPGDEVICPTLTFIGSVNPILYLGAKPVFIDSHPDNWNMDPQLFKSTIQKRAELGRLPKAVILVHLYGQPAEISPIVEICRKYDICLIEDAAESLGARYYGKPVGTFGKFGIFSFNGNKIITTSGGGMLISKDARAIEKAKILATQARSPARHYEHNEIGFNYRMSNVLAAIGRGQLSMLKNRVESRKRIFEKYRSCLSDLGCLHFMPDPPHFFSTQWLTVMLFTKQTKLSPQKLMDALENENIEARPVWKPMHLQPALIGYEKVGGKVAEAFFYHGICLPSGSGMGQENQNRVIDCIRNFFGKNK